MYIYACIIDVCIYDTIILLIYFVSVDRGDSIHTCNNYKRYVLRAYLKRIRGESLK